jgi:hypothetical protein
MNQHRPPGKKSEDFLVWLGRFVPEKGLTWRLKWQSFHEQIEPEIDHDLSTLGL